MTRIDYRPTQQMTDQERELTVERGNLNVYRALANAENVFAGWMEAGRAALTSPVLPARLREVVILRTAHLMNCPYEIGQHTPVASAAGISPRDITVLTSDSPSDTTDFSQTERAVVELTTQLLTTRHATAAVLDDVYRALGAEATIEVLMLINRWSGLALMLNALDVDLDEHARISIPSDSAHEAATSLSNLDHQPRSCS
jgi:AhpD family alkylhydroperoxidase